MKSKISFFNKTIFVKNATLYWPIWAIYTLILLISQPIILWFSYNDGYRIHALTIEQKTQMLIEQLSMEPYLWLIGIMAVVTGMAVFSYLYNSKSANMIHSLPVDRSQLYGTNVISGLAFLILPQILTFLVTMFVCLMNGVTRIEYIAIWLLLAVGVDVIAFSMVTFCSFFTGQLFAMPVYVIIVNGLAFWSHALINYFVSSFAYGVTYGSIMDENLLEWFSPFVKLFHDLDLSLKYEKGQFVGMEVRGSICLLVYMVVALILYAAAYLVYKRRHIEQAGDLITVSWVRPIFRWGVGTAGAFLTSLSIKYVFEQVEKGFSIPLYLVVLLLCGMVAYFIAYMLVQKSFKVFGKKQWKQCGIFSLILLCSFGVLYLYTGYCEQYIPNQRKVVSASIHNSYTSDFKGEDVEIVMDFHEEILENLEELEHGAKDGSYDYVVIRYELINGKKISRTYKIPYGDTGSFFFEYLYTMEMDADNFLSNLIGKDYDQITEFTSGVIGYPKEQGDGEEYRYIEYEYPKLTAEQCSYIYEAIIADAKAGVLQPYNGLLYGYRDYYQGTVAEKINYPGEITLYYLKNSLSEKTKYNNKDEESWVERGSFLNFGPDCTHIIEAMITCGIIENADQIQWDTK